MKRWIAIIGVILFMAIIWLATTDHDLIWPRRNFVYYQFLRRWWDIVGEPQTGPPGTLRGTILDEQGRPIVGARALVSRWDGTTYTARTASDGTYRITNIPAGRYQPVAGAPKYEDVLVASEEGGVIIKADMETVVDIILPTKQPHFVTPGTNLALGEPTAISCEEPIPSSATRRQVTFDNAGQPNEVTYLYTPITATTATQFPLLLTVYPGPADDWECVSAPLSAAGYSVLGIGPAYSLELAGQIDELERLLDFAASGQFPETDPTKIAVLGGSYSGLHVLLLFQRDYNPAIKAAVLLGAPTDIFAMRHYLEEKTFIPPFGLDKVLIALGLPDRQPMRYWRSSGAYHVNSNMPPVLVLHSYVDEVVPVDQSELLVVGLVEEGVPHQVYFFEGASHYLLSPSGESRAIYDLTLDFLAEYLSN